MTYIYIQPNVIVKSMMNDKDLIQQFVDMYTAQCPVDFDKLSKSIQQNDRQGIADMAHHMKPTMEYVGATALRLDFQELECVATTADRADIVEKFNILHAKFRDFMRELSHYRASIR
ncbi:hypothetical protein G5B30_13740 [Sphingobacterium sp. SGG-5]|uniref:Hpt domain-containing protein n=1 Tax=Sphingobacterium sp. SGG-5 TaxID=2710881 RepID=UPI0013E9B594|nr:Hpt domain-containing protein [Sphingobacterium sp. SGG-5]NGM62969.1 hypothetical protein [Sphingobacterium sp. SGG-5]